MPTFVIEDGTGLSNSTSYTSEAYADDYLNDVNWAATSAAKQEALMKATEYVDVRWGKLIRGKPLVEDQALEFPREYLYDRYGRKLEGVPETLQKAICEYAKEYVANGYLFTQSANTDPLNNVIKTSERKVTKVGPISKEVSITGTIATTLTYLVYPKADKMMRTYIVSGRVGRA